MAHALARRRAVEADEVEQRRDAAGIDAHHLRRHCERLAPATAGMLRGGVEQDADAASGVRELAVRSAEHGRVPGVGPREPAQHAHRGRLAGAVRSQEPGDGPRLAAERDVVDDGGRPEPLGQPLCLDHGREDRPGARLAPASPVDARIDFGRGSASLHRRTLAAG
jgi:hypothetical protein